MTPAEHRSLAEKWLLTAEAEGVAERRTAAASIATAHAILATIPEPVTVRQTVRAGRTKEAS